MQYPRLVPPKFCTAEVRVVFLSGVDIEGREAVLATYCGRCNLQQSTKQVLTADKRLVTLEAVALFDGDIAPHLSQPNGLLYFQELHTLDCENGDKLETEHEKPITFFAESIPYRIFRFTKARNPDGTVNYTRVELTR